MLLKIAMTKGDKKRRITECKPTDQQSTSLLNVLYPHTEWLINQPFDTAQFTLFVSDEPIGDEAAVTLPQVPYAEPAGRYSRFELRDDKGKRLGTSMDYPVTQLLLQTTELDPEIIAEQRPIYLAVGPTEKPEEVVIIDTPEATGVNTTIVECPPDETIPDESGPQVTIIDDVDINMSDQELAQKYLQFFLQHHVSFFKGGRLTSAQLAAAIEATAPDYIRTDLLERKEVVAAFRNHYGAVMAKHSARFGGSAPEKYWQDFCVRVHRPDPLERTWL